MWADQDPIFPVTAAESMMRVLRNARGLVAVSGAGHMLQEEDAGEEIATRILEWVAAGPA